ncbi:hypothetical protein [Odoribacter splanchnicus]|uniref:hypothetical protein n=1 Tax=Odoribacter splanchnicus TaxID=28118 RepID=UPI0034C4CF3E
MGRKGRKTGANNTAPISPATKRPHDNNRHRKLCLLAAQWLRRSKLTSPSCPYVAVELVTASQERPDVFGWNYWATVLIEVKVSRSDFLADAKKSFRQQPEEGVGAFRYYCSPEGLITEADLPDKWGLLWEKDGVITVVKDAERQRQNAQGEITILASIMRREGVKPQLFDYRKQNNEV